MSATPDPIAHFIPTRSRDLGGFTVRRALPAPLKKTVGPFIFLDHMGPADFAAGDGINVRPHPHIGLATVTYLFAGAIHHKDSLGSDLVIHPGDVNWMIAGRGITHSERTTPEDRANGQHLHGLQCWVALSEADEECDPAFFHHPKASLPTGVVDGCNIVVIAGNAYGLTSPVVTSSPTFDVEVRLVAGARLQVTDEHRERAFYVVRGVVGCGGRRCQEGDLVVLADGVDVHLDADDDALVVLLGGAPIGHRFIDWNFVSSRAERIEQAKDDWRHGRFPVVVGDDVEFIPLP